MKQISLEPALYRGRSEDVCLGRLVVLGAFFGLAMALLWQLAGPTPLSHALAWGVAVLAGFKFWRAIEGA
jgi:hypothetical protein